MTLEIRRGSALSTSLLVTLYIVSETPTKQVWRNQTLNLWTKRPFVLVDDALKSQILSTPWKTSIVQYFVTQATNAAATNLTVHKRWGGWSGLYVCSDGTNLKYDPNDSKNFYCPSSGSYYTGEPYATSWVTYKHRELGKSLFWFSLSYYFAGNGDHGKLATGESWRSECHDLKIYWRLMRISIIHCLLRTMMRFQMENQVAGMSCRDSSWLHDRIFSQTLDEAQWIQNTIIAYDLVANLMTSADRAFIEHNLFRSMIRTIYRKNSGLSNWQTWHNSAINAVGVCFGDSTMVNFALNSPDSGNLWSSLWTPGFIFQLQNSMMDDGIWYENSFGYHFFALSALQFHVGVAMKQGVRLDLLQVNKTDNSGVKSVKSMYSAPIFLAKPDYVLPDLNDAAGSLKKSSYYQVVPF